MDATSPGHRSLQRGVTWSIFVDGADSRTGSGSKGNVDPMKEESLDVIGTSGEALNSRSLEDDWEFYWSLGFPNASVIGQSLNGITNNAANNMNNSNKVSYTGDSQVLAAQAFGVLRGLGLNLETVTGAMLNLHQNTTVCSNYSGCGVGDAGVDLDLGDEGESHGWDNLWRVIPLGIVLAFLCLLTTAGNIMVLHAVRTEKRLQTVSKSQENLDNWQALCCVHSKLLQKNSVFTPLDYE